MMFPKFPRSCDFTRSGYPVTECRVRTSFQKRGKDNHDGDGLKNLINSFESMVRTLTLRLSNFVAAVALLRGPLPRPGNRRERPAPRLKSSLQMITKLIFKSVHILRFVGQHRQQSAGCASLVVRLVASTVLFLITNLTTGGSGNLGPSGLRHLDCIRHSLLMTS